MTTESAEEAERLAQKLCEINTMRQQIERDIFEQAKSRMAELGIENDMAVVVDGKDWHPGVIGIVASRILESCHRPVFVITVRDGIGRDPAGVFLLLIFIKPFPPSLTFCFSLAVTRWQQAFPLQRRRYRSCAGA